MLTTIRRIGTLGDTPTWLISIDRIDAADGSVRSLENGPGKISLTGPARNAKA